MSLKVWLPLTGTLENKGISNITISKDAEVTLNTNGKIGTCASCETNNKIITATVPGLGEMLGRGKSYTMCAWVKWLNHGTSGWVAQLATTNPTGFWWTNTSSNPRIVWNENDGGKRCGDNSLATDYTNWHHYAFVFTKNADGTSIMAQHYTDGVRSTSYPGTTWNGSSQNLASGDTLKLYPYTASINDFRIYDHALSAAEVKEISQGLVLHYKLDSFQGMRGNANLLKNIPKSYNSRAYLAYQLNFTENLVANQTYTLQLWDVDVAHSAKSAANLGIAFYWGGGSVQLVYPKGTSYFTNGHADYIKVSFTPTEANASHAHAANLWFNVYNSPSSASGTRSMSIGRWKLEKGSSATPWQDSNDILDIIQDSSGYGHNGTILGSPIISSDTARYTSSTSFPANADGILSTYPIALWNNAFTYSFWIKPSGENGGRSVYAASYNGTSCSIEKTTGNKLRFYWNGSPDLSTSSLVITDDIWQHIAIVKEENKTTVKCYYNGVLKDTFTNTFSDKTFSGDLRIARDTREDATSYTGMMSDFRIYCTALSADDIKSLYEMGGKIDNKQNLHIYEAIEMQSTIKLTKQGQMKAGEFQENTATKLYKTDQIIETNNLIEL